MERADVRMIQSRDRTRFTVETVGELGLEDLDRDGAVQSRVAGTVDFPHPARTDEGGQFVRAKASAWRPHRRKVYRRSPIPRRAEPVLLTDEPWREYKKFGEKPEARLSVKDDCRIRCLREGEDAGSRRPAEAPQRNRRRNLIVT
jgi:hypothetical protein